MFYVIKMMPNQPIEAEKFSYLSKEYIKGCEASSPAVMLFQSEESAREAYDEMPFDHKAKMTLMKMLNLDRGFITSNRN